MKKNIKKILLMIICILLIMFQTNYTVHADTIEQVKQNSDFKTDDIDGPPEHYDTKVEADKLVTNERLPAGVKTTIEDVLYNDSDILSVDFFLGSTSDQDNQNSIKQIVRNAFRVVLYIVVSAMIVILIYIGVVIVVSSIFPNQNFLPLSGLINEKGEKPGKSAKEKKFLEEWMKTVAYVTLVVVAMNMVTKLADNFLYTLNGLRPERNTITVYVTGSNISPNAAILGASSNSSQSTTSSESNSNTDSSTNSSSSSSSSSTSGTGSGTSTGSGSSTDSSNTYFTSSGHASELLQKVIDQAKSMDNLGVPGGYCEMWVEKVYRKALVRPSIPYNPCAHEAGQNAKYASSSPEGIVPGAAVFSFRSASGTIDSFCGQDAGHVGIYIGDGKIASCTGRGSTGITICTIDEWKQTWEFSCWGWLPGTEDLAAGATGEKYTSVSVSGYEEAEEDDELEGIFSNIVRFLTQGTKKVNYYFKTDIEGLLMFKSQYKSNLRKGVYLITGILFTIFKVAVYFLFAARMFILAFISVMAPILILINCFRKVSGNKGILKNWIMVYIYLMFIRVAVALVYYIMVQVNSYSFTVKVPIYVILVILVEVLMVFFSARYIYRKIKS